MEIRPVVIGTAGHIDHGKSSLVRALTGVDPDRLKEEKERGLTIDLGFAPLELADGRTVGLVDVPGHEKFVRNMVAGATGVDLVLLVVAADDGVMPQTREHLAILSLVGVQRGLVVLTKIDVVDPELVDMAEEDVHELLLGTFLEEAPVLRVDSLSGRGIPELLAALEELVRGVEPRPDDGVFRMPVQRVFSAKGFGTVVTGIPVSGAVAPGDVVEVLPGGKRAKVRGVHAYGQEASRARAGHSSALNLADVDHRGVERGAVIATPGFFRPTRMVGARLQALADLGRPITNRMPVRLHTGTSEARGEVIVLDRDTIPPGEVGLVQLRLEEPVVTAPGDRFVLRQLTPVLTLGGGVVLEESRHRLKRFKRFVIEELARQEESLASPRELLETVLLRRGGAGATPADLAQDLKLDEREVLALLEVLRAERRAASPGQTDRWVHAEALEGEFAELTLALDRWFGANPHRLRMDVRDLRAALGLDKRRTAALLEAAAAAELVEVEAGGRLRPAGWEGRLPEHLAPRLEALERRLVAAGTQPPAREDLPAELGVSAGDLALLVEHGQDAGHLRAVGDFVLAAETLEGVEAAIVANCQAHGELDIPALRTTLDTTRKYLIPLLEHFDNEGLTVRSGGTRILRRR